MARPAIAGNFTTAAQENQHLPGTEPGGVRIVTPPRCAPPMGAS